MGSPIFSYLWLYVIKIVTGIIISSCQYFAKIKKTKAFSSHFPNLLTHEYVKEIQYTKQRAKIQPKQSAPLFLYPLSFSSSTVYIR
ncbi:hypothetical protein GQ43DRAFT_22576 [Delitschia confertaspora ATCC 74209]|uniref:Uncharacterized protein n=1 Tax=Delitschia confertaspora ATCC 74209 TaxID=1513339 RepID=A0A9P4JR42_9PLEO|nr:hypothetical protein GQ43DRAFT_22576 [Delitschia confertaspora ATCC 74209]